MLAYQAGALQIDGALCALGAGAGNSPTEVLAATFERMGIRTGMRATAEIQALGFHQRSSAEYMRSFRERGVTAALSERDRAFGDYRESGD